MSEHDTNNRETTKTRDYASQLGIDDYASAFSWLPNWDDSFEMAENVLGHMVYTPYRPDEHDPSDYAHDAADSMTDVYASSLMQWLGRNWPLVDDYLDDFGPYTIDQEHSLSALAQVIQYDAYRRMVAEVIELLPDPEEEAEEE